MFGRSWYVLFLPKRDGTRHTGLECNDVLFVAEGKCSTSSVFRVGSLIFHVRFMHFLGRDNY